LRFFLCVCRLLPGSRLPIRFMTGTTWRGSRNTCKRQCMRWTKPAQPTTTIWLGWREGGRASACGRSRATRGDRGDPGTLGTVSYQTSVVSHQPSGGVFLAADGCFAGVRNGAGLFPRFFVVHIFLWTRGCQEGHPPLGNAEGASWAGPYSREPIGEPRGQECPRHTN